MKPEVNEHTKTVSVGPVKIGPDSFTVIAGPCSIENHQQFLTTANAVKKSGATLLRGGIWKLRTDPKAFQGLGTEAINFIEDVLKTTQLQLVSEITDPRQIESLDSVVSMYQVGARNMHNYALLKELGQTKKPVLLKRGFSALIEEWLKAADYVVAGGNDQVVLCERGIRTFETATRYTFDINAVAYVKTYTDFPIIVDPSHAVGIRPLVAPLCYSAAAAGADGIIVEVHPDPSKALSDGKQALTISDFEEMMTRLGRILEACDRPLQTIGPKLEQTKNEFTKSF